MPELDIGGTVARVPIIQGGMGVGLSLSGLASAVANEGGIGVIAGAGIGMDEPDFYDNEKYKEANARALRKEIIKARQSTKGKLGVNLLASLTNFSELALTAIREGIDYIFSGGGLPMDLREIEVESNNTHTKLVLIVSSPRTLRVVAKKWMRSGNPPDAVVVEGPLAGGHLGFKEEELENPGNALEKLVPLVREEIVRLGFEIPIIAAGGIYTGADIVRFLSPEIGASGVQMGTRFIMTEECEAPDEFKELYRAAEKEDIVLTKSPLGLVGRAVRNKFLDDVKKGKKHPGKCNYNCIKGCAQEEAPYCIFWALTNAKKGKMNLGFAFAGANAYRTNEIISVKELMDTLKREYEEAQKMAK